MTYKEIIENNCRLYCENHWWPQYAYHYTDIENALKILERHTLFSRKIANEKGLMVNDNANIDVINNTGDAVKYVRLYFRPLTPTQYRNEGYKHPDLKYHHNNNANVPVPVFFLFDLCQLLESTEGIKFSELGQAGYGSQRFDTIVDFSKFDFKKIYAKGPMSNPDIDKKYRHAEILIPDQLAIDSCLFRIVCRSRSEKSTLLNLLREKSRDLFLQYKEKVVICKPGDMFYKNGFAIEDCQYNKESNDIVITLSSTRAKFDYIRREKEDGQQLRKLTAHAQITWLLQDSTKKTYDKCFDVDYENPTYYTMTNIIRPEGARSLFIKIWIENKIMCYMTQHLQPAAIL